MIRWRKRDGQSLESWVLMAPTGVVACLDLPDGFENNERSREQHKRTS